MKFGEYVKSLSAKDRESYAKRCGTTISYLNNHLVPARKEPRRELRLSLASQSDGNVGIQEVMDHFSMAGDIAAATPKSA